MKLKEYQRSMLFFDFGQVRIKGQIHSLTLVKGHSYFKVKTCFSQKQLGDLEPGSNERLRESRLVGWLFWA